MKVCWCEHFYLHSTVVADGDYTPGVYVARFTPGSRKSTVAVNISDDHKLEGYEYFTARLLPTAELRNRNVRIGSRNTATISIVDDEHKVRVSFSPAMYNVSGSEGQVTIRLVASRTLQLEYTVGVVVTGGSSQEMFLFSGSAVGEEVYLCRVCIWNYIISSICLFLDYFNKVFI